VAPFFRERLLERLARWRVRRRRDTLPRIVGLQLGQRVYVGGTLGIEGTLTSISDDRLLATVVDDDGQAHWADGRRLYRL
jgi:hypothetical protein